MSEVRPLVSRIRCWSVLWELRAALAEETPADPYDFVL
eukprot:gene35612-4756_t